MYNKNALLTEFGDDGGDTFYIILKGEVGVIVPTMHKAMMKNYYELLYYLIKEDDYI